MSPKPRSTRAEVLALLRKGHALTLSDMTDRLPIDSKRQVRRHLTQLREAGVSIREERRGREKVFSLPPEELAVADTPVPLTEQQALALVVAAEAGRAALAPTPLADPLAAGFEQLLERLDRASGTYDLGRLREQWHFGTEPAASTFEGDVFDTLVEALNQGRPVRIAYEPAHSSDAPRERTVSPLVMAAPGGSWRCVAYCHYREAPRDFTLSRIENITLVTDDVATRPDDFDPDLYFHERFGALGGETRVVRLLVEPGAARYFREKSYHSSQVVEETRDDGRLVVSFEVEGLEDMTSWVQSWGPSVKVLNPPELAARRAEADDTNAALEAAKDDLAASLRLLEDDPTLEGVRGHEGTAAKDYFGVFSHLVRQQQDAFRLDERTRRPPRSRLNAVLSFLYTLLCNDCEAAAEGVGLDPQIGFLHAARPGRPSLGLDLMEELRAPLADRLALTLVNRRQLTPDDFRERDGGAVLLNEEGRETVLVAYQERKQDTITHPVLDQEIERGLLPHAQARLMARHLRGDLDQYVPYLLR